MHSKLTHPKKEKHNLWFILLIISGALLFIMTCVFLVIIPSVPIRTFFKISPKLYSVTSDLNSEFNVVPMPYKPSPVIATSTTQLSYNNLIFEIPWQNLNKKEREELIMYKNTNNNYIIITKNPPIISKKIRERLAQWNNMSHINEFITDVEIIESPFQAELIMLNTTINSLPWFSPQKYTYMFMKITEIKLVFAMAVEKIEVFQTENLKGIIYYNDNKVFGTKIRIFFPNNEVYELSLTNNYSMQDVHTVINSINIVN